MKKLIITLVHLGDHPAPYLWTNIEQLISRFPENEVALIYDKETFIEGSRPPGLTLHKYERNQLEQEVLEKQLVPMGFRSGYWRFTLERFLALHDFHKKNPEAAIFHIESDVLLLPGFPFEWISAQANLMWCPCDQDRDVGSLLFSPTPESSAWLAEQILKTIDSSEFITDMVILRRIGSKFPEKVQYFPTQIDHDSEFEIKESGIYDGAAIGLWLTGIDPRNYYGVTRVRDTKTILNAGTNIEPWKSTFYYSAQDGLFQKSSNLRVRIWNLHIHSKNMRLLGPDWERELMKYVHASKKATMSTEFDFSIFKDLIRTNYQQGQLIRFLLGHRFFTPLHRVRRTIFKKLSLHD